MMLVVLDAELPCAGGRPQALFTQVIILACVLRFFGLNLSLNLQTLGHFLGIQEVWKINGFTLITAPHITSIAGAQRSYDSNPGLRKV